MSEALLLTNSRRRERRVKMQSFQCWWFGCTKEHDYYGYRGNVNIAGDAGESATNQLTIYRSDEELKCNTNEN